MRGEQIKQYLDLCLSCVEKYEAETVRILLGDRRAAVRD